MKKITTIVLIGVLCAAPALAVDREGDRDAEKAWDEGAAAGGVASRLALELIDDPSAASDAPRVNWVGAAP